MLGWSISASACRSASNRATTWRGVHARLDDLQRDLAADGLLLLGHVDDAHAPLADLLEQLVRADPRAGPLGDGPAVAAGPPVGTNPRVGRGVGRRPGRRRRLAIGPAGGEGRRGLGPTAGRRGSCRARRGPRERPRPAAEVRRRPRTRSRKAAASAGAAARRPRGRWPGRVRVDRASVRSSGGGSTSPCAVRGRAVEEIRDISGHRRPGRRSRSQALAYVHSGGRRTTVIPRAAAISSWPRPAK